MKVYELIELLETCSQDAVVEINVSGNFYDITRVDVVGNFNGSSTVELQVW